MTEQFRSRANARIALALAALGAAPALGASVVASPAQWTDGPPERRDRKSRHVRIDPMASCTAEAAPPAPVDETAQTGVWRRLARGSSSNIVLEPMLVRVAPCPAPPTRYRSVTAMQAGFEIERLAH